MGRRATGNKSFPMMIRLSPEVRDRAMSLAKEDDRSFNSWVALLIKKAVEQGASADAIVSEKDTIGTQQQIEYANFYEKNIEWVKSICSDRYATTDWQVLAKQWGESDDQGLYKQFYFFVNKLKATNNIWPRYAQT